ncbi:MAG: LPS assembly lipoprotein LptE [Verrucomicrobiota bacterium]|nr:LPS assembly lipoprotein LptE [Verrucomicrobiota bacterium]
MKTVVAGLVSLVLAAALSGCAGYRLGDVKPSSLKSVHTLAINVFKNNTYIPRVEALVTDTVIKQFQQDGTYQITSADKADAVLNGTVATIGRGPARSLRGNVLATTEFNLAITVSWTLTGKDGHALAGPGSTSGGTSFFVGSDVTTDERQALPLAAEDLAVRLVSQLAEGW